MNTTPTKPTIETCASLLDEALKAHRRFPSKRGWLAIKRAISIGKTHGYSQRQMLAHNQAFTVAEDRRK